MTDWESDETVLIVFPEAAHWSLEGFLSCPAPKSVQHTELLFKEQKKQHRLHLAVTTEYFSYHIHSAYLFTFILCFLTCYT